MKYILLECIIFIVIIMFWLSNNIGISTNEAKNLYNQHDDAFNSVANIINDIPDMRITLNNDDFDDGRTHTYIDDMEISTYRIELSESQISAIEKTQIDELLKISRRGKKYFDSVIIRDGSVIFSIVSILGVEGIAYFENDSTRDNTSAEMEINEKTSIAPNWYYVRFYG